MTKQLEERYNMKKLTLVLFASLLTASAPLKSFAEIGPQIPESFPQLSSDGTLIANQSTLDIESFGDKVQRQYIAGKNEMLAFWTFQAGAVIPWHHHESEQITHVLKGELDFTVGIDEKIYHLKAGDVLIIPSNVPHTAKALTDVYELDIFSPIRQDWLDGSDNYLKTKSE